MRRHLKRWAGLVSPPMTCPSSRSSASSATTRPSRLAGGAAPPNAGVTESGNHAPVVVPGDPDGSLLVQKMLGTQTVGSQMPMAQLLPPEQVQVVIEWIANGASE